jgi:uncharacterized protein YxeA
MTFKKYIFCCLALIILQSCAIPPQYNYMVTGLNDNDLEIIVEDIIPMITAGNPTKKSRFILPHDAFGKKLSNQLGKQGYEVLISDNTGSNPGNAKLVRYIVDYASPKSLYVAITINSSQRYVRSYNINNGQLTPDKIKIEGRNDE